MSTPSIDYKNKLQGLRSELSSAVSCLYSYPEPIEHEEGRNYLVETDGMVKHANEHLDAVRELCNIAEKEKSDVIQLLTVLIYFIKNSNQDVPGDIEDVIEKARNYIWDEELNIPLVFPKFDVYKKYYVEDLFNKLYDYPRI